MILNTRLGNTPRWFLTPPKDYNMRIPDEMLNGVVFVGVKAKMGNREVLAPKGTAFFVGYPIGGGIRGHYLYLVTARHVVEKLGGGDFFIRANTISGPHEDVWARHGDPSVRWWFHPFDEAADVAVLEMNLLGDQFRLGVVPTSMFLTNNALADTGIGIGDEILMVGLFGVLKDTTQNLPIVRVGNIAMMPPEPIRTGRGKTDAYLIEARSIGGLSGSPAFVWEDGVLEEPAVKPERGLAIPRIINRIHFLGLMHGHWAILPEDRNEAEPRKNVNTDDQVNIGIAIVTPAWKILETLEQPGLKATRDAALEDARKGMTPTMDAM